VKEPRINPILKGIKTLLFLAGKLLGGLILFAFMCFLACGSLVFIYAAMSIIMYVEPPTYPNAERLAGLQGSGSGGSWVYKNYCTSDNYTDVIEYMDEYFPDFKYDSAKAMYYSVQANPLADIVDFLLELGESRSIAVYVNTPDDVDNCLSGTYFVIYESSWD
jgi:hypothetical protein